MARRIKLTFHGSLLILIVVVLGLMAAAPARQAYDQQKRIEQERQKLEALRKENARLSQRLQRLEDPEYLEKLAREQLDLVRPGETSYVVVPGPVMTKTATATATPDRPWYAKLWRWMGSVFRD